MAVPEPILWYSAGNTLYTVMDGRILAVLYWADVGQPSGPEGEPATDAAWMIAWPDEFERHYAVNAPATAEGAEQALKEATRMVEGRYR